MSDIFEDMFEEDDVLSSIDTDTSKQLSSLVRKLRSIEETIEKVEHNRASRHSIITFLGNLEADGVIERKKSSKKKSKILLRLPKKLMNQIHDVASYIAPEL